MISFIRLVNGGLALGKIIKTTPEFIIVENCIEMGSFFQEQLEQNYYFKGMMSPFAEVEQGNIIYTEINRDAIISIDKKLDSSFVSQYNNYITKWFEYRVNIVFEELESDDDIYTVDDLADISANTSIH